MRETDVALLGTRPASARAAAALFAAAHRRTGPIRRTGAATDAGRAGPRVRGGRARAIVADFEEASVNRLLGGAGLVLIAVLWCRTAWAGPLFVTDFGADNGGVVDATDAVQRALDAAGPGGTVVFPRGTYRVGEGRGRAPLFRVSDGMTVRGERATLRCANPGAEADGCRPFSLGAFGDGITSGVTIEGLRFEEHGIAIRLADTQNVVIRDNVFFNSAVYLWNDLGGDGHGNAATEILNNRFEVPDYRDPAVNPDYVPNRLPPYGNDELSRLRYYLPFLLRIASYPWDERIAPSTWNQDVVVRGNSFTGAAYNAVELAGHAVRRVRIENNVFEDNYGVAIDFDKGASHNRAVNNMVYDMRPTETYDAGEIHAIGAQRGGRGSGRRYIPSSHNVIRGNRFLQRDVPYTKMRAQSSFDIVFADNEILPGDRGGNAVTLSFGERMTAPADHGLRLLDNTLRTGDVLVAGGVWLEPEIAFPIVLRGNLIGGAFNIMNHDYRRLTVTGNSFLWPGDVEGFKITGRDTVLRELTLVDNAFVSPGGGVVSVGNAETRRLRGNTFEGVELVD